MQGNHSDFSKWPNMPGSGIPCSLLEPPHNGLARLLDSLQRQTYGLEGHPLLEPPPGVAPFGKAPLKRPL